MIDYMNYLLQVKDEESSELIRFAIENLMDSDGEFRLEMSEAGLSHLYLYHDLGDITPFLVNLGEEQLIKNLLSKVDNLVRRDGGLVSGSLTFGRFKGFSKSYEYTDFLLGLEDCYRSLHTPQSKNILLSQVKHAEKIFKFGNKHSSYYSNRFRVSIPIVDTRDIMFIEIYCDLSESLESDIFLSNAMNQFHYFRELRKSDSYGLLPDFQMNRLLIKLLGYKPNYTLMKNHTNALHAYIRLYDKTKDSEILFEIEDLVDSISKHFQRGDGSFSDTIRVEDPEASLKASFAMIEFFVEYQLVTGDNRYEGKALDIVQFWEDRLGSTGLFPMSSGTTSSFIDSQTDMVISLWRLGALAQNHNVVTLGDKAFYGLREFHGKNRFPLNVDVNTGLVLDNTIRTKFVFLYLKALIALKIRNTNLNLLNTDNELRRLLRDR